MAWIPGAEREFRSDRERCAVGWLWIVEPEIVDKLLDANRTGRWQCTIVDESPDVRVRGGVHVDRERRERVGIYSPEAVLFDGVVRFRIEGTAVP
jgi:hypothetical protein